MHHFIKHDLERNTTIKFLIAIISCVIFLSVASRLSAAESTLPLKPERNVSFETGEGTWMSLDTSPDGKSIIFELLGDIYTLDIKGGQAKPLSTGMAFDSQPVYSPDGTKIAFISDRSGNDNLWVINADGSNPYSVSKDKGSVLSAYVSPAWSADGDAIYVSRFNDSLLTHIWMYYVEGGKGIQLTGTTPETIQTNNYGAAPSHDGQYLYHTRQKGGIFPFNVSNSPDWVLVQRNLKTGAVNRLINAPGKVMRPVISPDNRYIAYATRYESDTELRLRNLETGEDKRLVYPIDRDMMQQSIALRDLVPGYDFTPDGKEIVIAYGGKIHRVSVNTGTSHIIPFTTKVNLDIGPNLKLAQKDNTGPVRARIIQYPRVSPDGKHLAFSAFGKLYTMPVAGGKPARITSTKLTQDGITENQASWSPDGRWLTYVSWKREGGHIWKTRANGKGKPKRLTDDAGYYRKPVFTPDGKSIIALRSGIYDRAQQWWTSNQLPYSQNVIRLSSKGGKPEPIAELPHWEGTPAYMTYDWGRPHFTQKSDTVYLSTQNGLLEIPVNKGNITNVVQIQTNSVFPLDSMAPVKGSQLSPDGKWALVQNNGYLYVLAVPKTGIHNFTINLQNSSVPLKRLTDIGADYFDWGADGKTINWSIGSTFYRFPFSEDIFKESITNNGTNDNSIFFEDNVDKIDIVVEQSRDIPDRIIVLRGATAVTMKGDEVIENADIVINNNRIEAIGPRGQVEIPLGASIRNVSGKTITPGFIDTHSHWLNISRGVIDYNPWEFPITLAYGITSGLDVQTMTHDMFVYQDLIDIGVFPGPRAYNTGRQVTWNHNFTSKKHALGVLSRYKNHYKTNNIKAYASGNRLQRQYVAQAAKELGLMPTTENAWQLKSHLNHVIDGFAATEHAFSATEIYNDIIQLYSQSQAGYTPTVIASANGLLAEDYFFARQNPLDNPKLNYFTPKQFIDDRVRRRNFWGHKDEFVFDRIMASAAKIFRAGGKLGVGGHGNLQGLGYHWELQAYAMGGLTPHEVLQIATRSSAEVIGRLPDIGTLEPGKYADLIIFDKNPLDAIRNTESIEYVMKNGRLYNGDNLKEVSLKQ